MILDDTKRKVDHDATAAWTVYKDKVPKVVATTSQDGSELTLEAQRQQESSIFKDLACVWALKRAFAQDRLYVSDLRRAFEAAGKLSLCNESNFKALVAFDGMLDLTDSEEASDRHAKSYGCLNGSKRLWCRRIVIDNPEGFDK